MLSITCAPSDRTLSDRVRRDLEGRGHAFSDEIQTGRENVLIVLVSPPANDDPVVQAAIIRALDQGLHLVPVLAAPVALPRLIDHLKPLDFSAGYDLDALEAQIRMLTAPGAPLPLKVLTPRAQRRNRTIGYWLTILVLVWFIVGIILVGFFGVQAPRQEYDAIGTQVALTVEAAVERNLPRSTQDAANFPATVQAVPTAQRPLLIATATALAGQ